MSLHPNVILDQFDAQAVFEIRSLPTHGVLTLNGEPAKPRDRFTHLNLRDGTLSYSHTKNEGNTTLASDSFKFMVPLPDGTYLKANSPIRNACLPPAVIPDDGIFTFDIKIVVIPYPEEIVNNEITIMEDETRVLGLGDLFYKLNTQTLDFYRPPPQPPIQPPNPGWERYPIKYTVRSVSSVSSFPTMKAEYHLNGSPLANGTTFTHDDLLAGTFDVSGRSLGAGNHSFSFYACYQDTPKCKTGTFNTKVVAWPYPETENNQATIAECQTFRPITPGELMFKVDFGSTDAEISIQLDEAATAAANTQAPQRVRITPANFTQADINAGTVLISHECGEDPTAFTEVIVFNVCTNHGKCLPKRFYVKVVPAVVTVPPQEPDEVTLDNGCTYKKNAKGAWKNIQCGVWAEVSGRLVPDPEQETEGKIIHMKDTKPPMTLVLTVNKKGKKQWVQLDKTIPSQPSGDAACEPKQTAPNSKKDKATISFNVAGSIESGGRPVKVIVEVDGRKSVVEDSGFTVDFKNAPLPTVNGAREYDSLYKSKIGTDLKKDSKIVIYQEFSNANANPATLSNVRINGKAYKFDITDGGNKIASDVNTVTFATGGTQRAVVTAAKGFAEPKVTGEPKKCFTAPDGTKWISDKTGDWAPVDTDPDMVDVTPIVTADPDAYVVQVDKLTDIPKNKLPEVIYVKKKNTLLQLQEDETYAAVPTPFTEKYTVPPFNWVGPNEFWLPYGSEFDMPFFANRMYVRVDIQGGGVKAPQELMNAHGAKFFSPYSNIGGGYSATTKNQVTVPCRVNYAYTPSNGNDPYDMGEYFVEYGNNNLASFCAAIRPVKLPEKTDTGSTIWTEDTSLVFSYSGYGTALRQKRANVSLSGKGKAPADGGAKYGSYYPYLHNEVWQIAGNTNFNPPEPYGGWQIARLKTIVDRASGGGVGVILDMSPYSAQPPKRDYTFSFNAKATDITSGETITRNFKIHWTKDGTGPGGVTSTITDLDNLIEPNTSTPKDGTAVCKFLGDGSIGSCKII